ncbi:MAG: FAD-dependent monooxygenase [Pseudomonadota bacterium]
MKPRYDVTVIGAGPAGLLAAKALAQNGFDVAVLERKKDLAVITRACGQSLLPPNEYFFGDIFHYNAKDKRFCFSSSGLSFPYTGPVKNLYTWHMFSPAMNKMQFGCGEEKKQAPIAVSYDKEIVIKNLLQDLACDHVDVFAGTEYTDMQVGPGTIVVQAGDKAFQSSYVIAADGTNSRVVQKLGYNNNRRHIANLYVQSCFIKGFNPPHDNSIITAVTFIDEKPVYLFLLPRPEGGEWNFIILTLEGKVDLPAAYDRITKDTKYAAWFKGATKTQEFAAIEYIYSPIQKPFRNNVLIVGDAGACQELECLGAMITGWRGGLAIAGALKEQELGIVPRAISQYEDWWLNTYIKQYDYQDYLSIFGLAYMFSKPEVIDYIFGLMGAEPFPATFNPYTAVGLLGARLQSLMPKIMGERPDILQQLAGTMLMFPSDIMGRTLSE